MKSLFAAFLLLFFFKTPAQTVLGKLLFRDDFSENLSQNWQFFERGTAKIENGVLRLEGKFAVAGDPAWKNYELKFKARCPVSNQQINKSSNEQIWAGVRFLARDQRHAFAIRGGNHDDLWLARFGYLGTDEFLALRPLEFSPRLDEWQTVRIQVFDHDISVFLNEEKLPRIQIRDSTNWLPTGKIVLGGGWLPVEFDEVEVREILSQKIDFQEFKLIESAESKAIRRAADRKKYLPKTIQKTSGSRQEISLDGNWLFQPDYEIGQSQPSPLLLETSDENFHLLEVPNFWNENRVWLHGEDAMMKSGDKGVSDNFRQLEIARCEGYTFDYRRTEVGFYRHLIDLDSSFFAGERRVFRLQFDAISKIGELWVNGNFAGRHVGMFGEFTTDISKFLKPGRNLLAVKVIRNFLENTADAQRVEDIAVTVEVTKKMLSDLPHGIFAKDPAGIWQPVRLLISNPVFIEDFFFKPNLNGAEIDIQVSGFIENLDYEVQLKSVSDNSILFTKNYRADLKKINENQFSDRILIENIQPKLWSPEHPNLYQLEIKLVSSNIELDKIIETVGFRTFETRGDFFYLNNKPYRIRGANHSPMSIRPNDAALADTFFRWMHDDGMFFTRTTTSPFSKIWMQAADRQGVAVSFEGQFPWLMMRGDIPDERLLNYWRAEFFDLLRKYRNHPSLLLWTVNNEMKFYEKDTNKERVKQKFTIISDVVRRIRQLDGTRPVIFDSGYRRDSLQVDKDFIKTIDDGDADDVHSYINWYYYSVFDYFNGEFSKWYKNKGRPLISQEFSSGYPNNDAGHPVRFYPFSHYVGQALLGRAVFEDHDPQIFLDYQAFISKEGHEAVRRSTPDCAGLQQFSSICWFRDVYDAARLQPYPAYFSMKKALQPVLISAELFGRHFYAGNKIQPRICLINDDGDGRGLAPTKLLWSVDFQGITLKSGERNLPAVPHFSRVWDSIYVVLPNDFKEEKIRVKLKLEVFEQDKMISTNDYDLLISKEIVLDTSKKDKGKPFLIETSQLNKRDFRKIKRQINKGSKVVFLGGAEKIAKNFPKIIDSIYKQPAEIATMLVPESPIFEGIGEQDLRWFNNGQREKPLVCRESFYISEKPNVEKLAQFTVVHGYINPAFHVKHERVREFTGFPLVRARIGNRGGEAIFCTFLLEKGATDPVCGQLLRNLLNPK